VLFRWDAPLFFANADVFRTGCSMRSRRRSPKATWIVVAAER